MEKPKGVGKKGKGVLKNVRFKTKKPKEALSEGLGKEKKKELQRRKEHDLKE